MSNLVRLLKMHFWGVLLIVVLLIGSSFIINRWKESHPGSMTVLESQAMDMTVMKPTVGAVPVASEIVKSGNFIANVTYTGSVAPLQEQIIYTRVEGYLNNLSIYNGDHVARNQLIAIVDSPDIQSRVAEAAAGSSAASSEIPTAQYNVVKMSAERAASQGEIRSAKSELARAKAMALAARNGVTQKQQDVKSAKANLEYWDAEIAREQKLLNSGAVSTQEYQSEKSQATTAEAEYENKQAMLEEAKANVKAAEADVASKQAMLSVAKQRASAASAALTGAGYEVKQKAAMAKQAGAMAATAASIDKYRYVRAPFAGTVTKRYVSPGQFVNSSTAIASIVQIDSVRLQANVSDKDLGNIKIGAPVTAHFAKDAKLVIIAKVTSISPLADQSSRTAVVEAIIPNPGNKLVPGDSVTMDIGISNNLNAISIPSSAIVQKNGESAVWMAVKQASKGKMQYTCTMHPQIIRDHPGNCPICHMKLVPMESSSDKKAHLVMITTGLSAGDRILITSGLSEGDEVIYKGNTYLKENDTLFITEWTDSGPKNMPEAPGMENMPGMDKSDSSDMENMPGMNHSKMKTGASVKISKVKAQKTYACPMHPQVTSNKPGNCRICGMKLELKK